jgi:hypothetical protein
LEEQAQKLKTSEQLMTALCNISLWACEFQSHIPAVQSLEPFPFPFEVMNQITNDRFIPQSVVGLFDT